jgi:hypothetical protein
MVMDDPSRRAEESLTRTRQLQSHPVSPRKPELPAERSGPFIVRGSPLKSSQGAFTTRALAAPAEWTPAESVASTMAIQRAIREPIKLQLPEGSAHHFNVSPDFLRALNAGRAAIKMLLYRC